jgi:hypothetical protein
MICKKQESLLPPDLLQLLCDGSAVFMSGPFRWLCFIRLIWLAGCELAKVTSTLMLEMERLNSPRTIK